MAIPLWGTIKGYILGAWSWLDDPIEGLWDGFRTKILGAWSWLNTIDDKIVDRVRTWWPYLSYLDSQVISWIQSRWPWLLDPIEEFWDGFRAKILGAWSWLNTLDDKIVDRVKTWWPYMSYLDSQVISWIQGRWTWLNTIDDRIRDTVKTEWSWVNTIDDRIRDLAWSHIAPKLGDWFWSFVVLEVTLMSKIGYRVLSTLWGMEWDDANKEAK
jgi:hypothetical protein